MKTKDVIKKLKEVDPSGELECAIDGNEDIFDIFETESYWDGSLQILKRDHSKDPYYNICGGIITGKGTKVNIKPLSIYDAISNNVDLPVEIEGYTKESTKQIRDGINNWREDVKKIDEEIRQNKYCKNEKEVDLCFKCKNLSHEIVKQTEHFCNKLEEYIGTNWKINKNIQSENCISYTEKKEKDEN